MTVSRKRPVLLVLLAALFLLFAGAAAGLWWQQDYSDTSVLRREENLKQENLRLVQALQQAELQAKHEISLRESLERQLAEQSEELKRLRGELAFFQKNRK